MRRDVAVIGTRVGETHGRHLADLSFHTETDGGHVAEFTALQTSHAGAGEIHRSFGFRVAEEVVPSHVALQSNLGCPHGERNGTANAKGRHLDILIFSGGREGHRADLFVEAVGFSMDPAQTEVRLDAVGVRVETGVGGFSKDLRDVRVAREGVHAKLGTNLQSAGGISRLMAVDETVGGVDHITEVRDAISTEVDVVAFNLVVARLVVGRTGTKEETELRGGADVNFSTEEAGVEVAVHVGLAVVKRRPAADTRRPEASRAVGHFDLAAFTDARGLILDGAGERHAVHDARIARIEDEVVAQRVVGLGNVTLRSTNESVVERTARSAFKRAGNGLTVGVLSVGGEALRFVAGERTGEGVAVDLNIAREERVISLFNNVLVTFKASTSLDPTVKTAPSASVKPPVVTSCPAVTRNLPPFSTETSTV